MTSDAAPVDTTADDPYAPIIADFRAAMNQVKCASSERLVRMGVSMAQVHIMYTLQRNGGMTMSHLADVVNVSLSNATGLIDRLEERGGFADRIDCVGLRQLKAWNSGDRASSENAMARVKLSDCSSCGERA